MSQQMSYVWSTDSADSVDEESFAMSHTGVAITRSSLVITGASSEAALVIRDGQGSPVRAVSVQGVTELHDLTLVEEDGEELLWVADTGVKFYGGGKELEFRRGPAGGQVIQVDLDGRLRRNLAPPPLEAYEAVDYMPTSVVADERRLGGSGDIWVADGYGTGLVHRYSDDGTYLGSVTGEHGAGRFDQPHHLLIDRRRPSPELYVADRKNHRIQVYDLQGQFIRLIGDGLMPGPTQMAVSRDTLVVTDLLAGRLTLFDIEDRLLAHLFPNPSPPLNWDALPDPWPNVRSDAGVIVRAELEQGVFHSPHGVAADTDGKIYVSEFAIGGRFAVLTPDSE